ncbi:hypothetical protein ACF3M1_08055 [Luteimonas sp. WGS1318]|uniref:hypothetical protein n=1 Tax=Luteimonas sp. WGS1318 TaxID=3366815 RepID=UPI00372D7760
MQARSHRLRSARWLIAVLGTGLSAALGAQVPGRCETPVGDRQGEIGCYLLDAHAVPDLPAQPLYWHIVAFPALADARAAVAGPRQQALMSQGRAWLFAIEPQTWNAGSGERIAVIGPLPVTRGLSYTARYMESSTPAGMRPMVHAHSGPEAFHVLEGAQCVQTQAGATVIGAGENGITDAETPMTLVGIGPAMRRALVLVLHDTSRPWSTMSDWTPPAGACEAAAAH